MNRLKESKDKFKFKKFDLIQENSAMKVGFDAVLLGAWCPLDNISDILDVGTGTGVIALMLAQRTKNALIDAIEIEDASYREACQNAVHSSWSERVVVFHKSLQEFAKECSKIYDLIVCNPPFFSGGTLSSISDRNSVRHTTKLAHNELLQYVRRLLSKDGKLAVVLPFIEGLRFVELARQFGFHPHRITEVLPRKDAKVERLLLFFGKQKKERIDKDHLIIREGELYTEEYKKLTGEFYLKF